MYHIAKYLYFMLNKKALQKSIVISPDTDTVQI